jgi:hypothetical protein
MTERQVGLITEALEYALDDMDISPTDYLELDKAITATLDILRYYDD